MQVDDSWSLAALVFAIAGLSAPDVAAAAAVEISIQRLQDASVVARYVFDEEINEFQFLVKEQALRERWRLGEESLTLANGAVSSITGSPFRAATLTLAPNQESGPASPIASPTLISMGPASTLVNLTYLRVNSTADSASFVLHNAFDESVGACVARRTIRLEPDELAGTAARYAFVSTALERCESALGDGERTIFSADTPSALRQLITHDFAQRYESLRSRLGTPSPKLTLFVAHKGRQNGIITKTSRGADGTVLAQLEGDSWAAPTAITSESLMANLLSSVLTGWLGGADVVPSMGRSLPRNWLVAGAATYVAILDGIEHGRAADSRVKGSVAFVDLCARLTTSRPLEPVEGPPITRRPGYCGLLVQLVYDAMTRAESAGERTIYDLWAETVAAADGTGSVDPAVFVATNPRAEAALAGLLYGPEVDFEPIVAALQAAGVDAVLGETPDSGGAVFNLVMPFLTKACPGVRFGFGFAGQDTGIGFNAQQPCDHVPAQFAFINIEARSIYSSARDIHDAVRQACTTKGSITLTSSTAALPELTLACPERLPDVQASLKIRDLGVLLP